jgi:phenylacetic acid degradation operon negative regulatory protein
MSPMTSGGDSEDRRGARGLRVTGTRRGSPPSLLLMLFGDYWLESPGGFPSAALVTLLGDFGVNDAAARAALSRMVKRGLLRSSKTGRTTAYRTSSRTQQILTAASRRIVEFGGATDEWSGVWSVVAFSIPENGRSLRAAARNRLRWLGFAPLYDEVWICPHDRHEDAVRDLAALGVEATALQASVAESASPTRAPQNAWDLDQLASEYHDVIEQTTSARELLTHVDASPSSALVQRTRLLEAWLDLSSGDPNLPATLLPADWPREHARDLFLETHDALGDLATERVRAVVASVDPASAQLVERRAVADWVRLVA